MLTLPPWLLTGSPVCTFLRCPTKADGVVREGLHDWGRATRTHDPRGGQGGSWDLQRPLGPTTGPFLPRAVHSSATLTDLLALM